MKQFKLPKDFAELWIEALESEEYEQGKRTMCQKDDDGIYCYCCLGVAEKIMGANSEDLREYAYPAFRNLLKSRLPNALIYSAKKDPEGRELMNILMNMNDGAYHKDHNPHQKRFNFKQIAQWIRDNVELTDTPFLEKLSL